MKTIITVKTDNQIKKKAAKLAAQYGLSLSDIVNVSLAQFVHTKSLQLGQTEQPSTALLKVIAQSEADLVAGKSSKKFDRAQDAIKFLGL